MKSPVLCLFASLLITVGCANWNASNESSSQPFVLAKSRMSPRSVGIEIAVAQLDATQEKQLRQLLRTVDQQELSLETRQQLDRNGLTCGIMSTRPPAVFHDLLESYVPDPESVGIAAKPLALAGKLDPISRLLTHQRIFQPRWRGLPGWNIGFIFKPDMGRKSRRSKFAWAGKIRSLFF